jgi:hypothetical protein
MPYKDTILDPDTFADKSVAGNLAASSDARVLLDLDESADFSVVSDLATIQVDKPGKLDIVAKLDVRSDA